MADFTLDDLATVAQNVIGGRRRPVLEPTMTAKDVPGWDSLNHTLIVIEIGDTIGRDLSARDLATCADFASMVAMINGGAAE